MVETGDIHGIGRGRGFGAGVVINWELTREITTTCHHTCAHFPRYPPPPVARSQLASSAHYKKHVSSLLAIYFRMVHITFRNGHREIKSMPSGTESCTHTVAHRCARPDTRALSPLSPPRPFSLLSFSSLPRDRFPVIQFRFSSWILLKYMYIYIHVLILIGK